MPKVIPETSEDSASSCSTGQNVMLSGKKDGPFLTGIGWEVRGGIYFGEVKRGIF